jgi:hypothetical protein
MITEKIIVPAIHLNGTSKKELLRQVEEAGEALVRAIDALYDMAPNGRDYYHTGNFKDVVEQHQRRVKLVTEVKNDIDVILDGLDEQD